MITLAQLGPAELKRRLEAQDRAEMIPHAGGSTDITMQLPGPLGRGGLRSRKQEMLCRLLIEQELHVPLIQAEIYKLYDTEDGRRATAKFAKATRNVMRVVANRLAVVYERPPVRQFGRGGSQKMAKAWRATVLEEGRFDLNAEQWARLAFELNVVHTIPQIIDDKLCYETILPHAADVLFGPAEREPSILVYLSDGDGWSRVAVDCERYWYLDDSWRKVGEFAHGYRDLEGKPMRPWTEWRVRPRLGTEDYWQRGVGRQLVDATLSVGVTAARMAYIRKNNSGKMSTLTERRGSETAPGQRVSPERPLMLQDGVFQVHDMVVSVEDFLAEMDSEIEEVAEAYGVPRGALDRSKSTDAFAEHQSVAKQRTNQIKHVRAADMDASIKTAIVMRADRHPATAELDPARVAKSLRLRFHELTYQSDPIKRFEAYGEELSLGLADHVMLRQREHPDEDAATAEANVLATIEQRNKFSNLLAKHQLAADASEDGENLAQRQGRIGGRAPGRGNDERDQRDQQQRQ